MKPVLLEYRPNSSFKSKTFQRLAYEAANPELPPCPRYEPWEEGRAVKTRVLTRDEERVSFLTYNFWKLRYNQQLRKKNEPGMEFAMAQVRHFEEYLCRLNLPLVYSMVARNTHRFDNLDWGQAVSEGQSALLRALAGFNVEVGTKFSTYAVRIILNSLSSAHQKAGKNASRVVCTDLPDVYGGEEDLPSEDKPEADELDALRHVLEQNIGELSDDEQVVIALRFGLGDKPNLTLEQIADNMDLSKERIRQIQNAALAKMRDAMELVG